MSIYEQASNFDKVFKLGKLFDDIKLSENSPCKECDIHKKLEKIINANYVLHFGSDVWIEEIVKLDENRMGKVKLQPSATDNNNEYYGWAEIYNSSDETKTKVKFYDKYFVFPNVEPNTKVKVCYYGYDKSATSITL
ncbi:hypothetical protein [Clostridium sp.]|uniref:hypothetical protein n=1 Tax=Clostridium sp. TaxID=1506 RepID=UPI002601EF00|nr:hypothetical protein [Clostridium sp.]